MSPKTKNIGIMFADVVGSTQLFELLGDDIARATIAETLELLTSVTNSHGGTVIKTIGDEVMCTFPKREILRMRPQKCMKLSKMQMI